MNALLWSKSLTWYCGRREETGVLLSGDLPVDVGGDDAMGWTDDFFILTSGDELLWPTWDTLACPDEVASEKEHN